MKSNSNKVLLFLLVVACLMPSCKKSGSVVTPPDKFTGCRISKIERKERNGFKNIYTFSYNTDGTISRISAVDTSFAGNDYVTRFTYKTGYFLADISSDGNQLPYNMDSIITDAQGHISSVYHSTAARHTTDVWDNYEYDNDGNMVYYKFQGDNRIVGSENYQWKDKDLQWNSAGSFVYYYTYGTAVYNTGNITARIDDLLKYGRSLYTPKHLVTQAIRPSISDTINYINTLDAGGRITQIREIESGMSITTTNITYECQ